MNIRDCNKKLTDFYDIMMSRKSVREYTDREIEKEKLDRLTDIIRRSQSAANRQPWHFIILKKGKERIPFETLLHRESFKEAPVIIVACTDSAKAWTRKYDGVNYAIVDVTIALTDMIAAATAEGLGTCWIASFDPKKTTKILNIPEGIEPIGLITLGYPVKPLIKEDKNRKPLEEIIHYNRW